MGGRFRFCIIIEIVLICFVFPPFSIVKGNSEPNKPAETISARPADEDAAQLAKQLFTAVQAGDMKQVKILLNKGADVNASDRYGLTPLHLAAAKGHKDIVELLIANGARIDPKDSAGRTPLHYASGSMQRSEEELIQKSFVDIVKLLLDNEANINAQDNIGWTPLRYAVAQRNQDVAIKRKTGETPYKSIVELLIARGTDLSLVDYRGDTAYSWNRERASFQARHALRTPHEYINEYCEIAKLLRVDGGIYIVALDGKDDNPGTLERPFKTITAALEEVGPGDVIYVRGGTYRCERSIRLDKSGGRGNPICLKAYPGETPILDFSDVRGDSLFVSGTYWHIKGLVVVNGYYGMMVWGPGAHHNILEQITAHANGWGGILFRDGAAYNIALNCDSHKNFDPEYNGDTCDGFSVAFYVGQGNVFIGNRSWNNSDDGYDCWRAGETVRFERCSAWNNGENIWNHPFFFGNSNGFKLGTGDGKHVLVNCLAWGHRGEGFSLNGNTSGVTLRNCSARSNRRNYSFESTYWESGGAAQGDCIFMNNISYDARSRDTIHKEALSQNNSWDPDLGITLTDKDFLSLDDSKMSEPRNPDGSIPQNDFLKLAPGSAAIDKGMDVNMPFVGKAPDLGAFECDPNEKTQNYVKMLHQYVRDHDIEKINKLLAAGTDVNEKDWLGYAPLHWACYFGYADLAELLLSKGADPNLISDTGRTCLEIVAEMNYENISELLRKNGAKK